MLDGSCVWVPSKDAAALTALERLPYDQREYSGAIYKNDKGEYCYSVPVPGSNDNFQFRTDKTGGMQFDGIYHTHPGRDEPEKFSPNDVNVADQLNRTSYIRANETGEVKRYDPGISPTSKDNVSRQLARAGKTSQGTSLGNLKKEQLAELLKRLGGESTPTDDRLAMAGTRMQKDQLE